MHIVNAETEDDFQLTDYGSVLIIDPLTPEAREWMEREIHGEIWYGGGVAVDHRCALPIVQAMRAAGFKGGMRRSLRRGFRRVVEA